CPGPPGALRSLPTRRSSDLALKEPGVESAVAFPGLSIAGFTNSSNAGIVFVTLKPFAERTTPNLSGGAIAMALNQKFFGIDEARSEEHTSELQSRENLVCRL